MNGKILTKDIICSISLTIIYIITSIVCEGEHMFMSLIVQISTILLSIYYMQSSKFKKYNKGFIILILPFSLLILVTCFFSKNFKIGWIYILMPCLLYYITVFSFGHKKYYFLTALLLTIPFITSFFLLPNIATSALSQNRLNEKQLPVLCLIDKSKKQIKINNSKIVILEFWTTNCGVCFKKFPDLEKLYLKYKKNKEVEILSVNILLPTDNFKKVTQLVEDLNYKFPTVYAESKNNVFQKLNFNYVPYYIILKNNKILYSGVFQIEDYLITGNPELEIEKLLNN